MLGGDACCVVMGLFAAEDSEQGIYDVEILGERYVAANRVFSPKYRPNSVYFAEKVPQFVRGSYLGIGAGAGVLEVILAKAGVPVVATEVCNHAFMVIEFNATDHGVDIEILYGDLFEPVGDRQFDTIFWNHPWLYAEVPVENRLLPSFDYEYRSLRRYFKQGHNHLKPGGQLLLGTGSVARLDLIEGIADEFGYAGTILCRDEIPLSPDGTFPVDAMVYQFLPR